MAHQDIATTVAFISYRTVADVVLQLRPKELDLLPQVPECAHDDRLRDIIDQANLGGTAHQIEQVRQMIAYDHKHNALAIAFAAIPPMMQVARQIFRRLRENMSSTVHETRELEMATAVLLCVNADHYSAWNARKRYLILNAGYLQPIEVAQTAKRKQLEHELQFVALVLSRHPKSGETWAHRRWCIELLQDMWSNSNFASPANKQAWLHDIIQQELQVVNLTASNYAKNYYSWTHRLIVLKLCALFTGIDAEKQELLAASQWTDRNVSEHCAFHYRFQVIHQIVLKSNPKLAKLLEAASSHERLSTCCSNEYRSEAEANNICSLIVSESAAAEQLIASYPGHETLWCYRRMLALYEWAMQCYLHGYELSSLKAFCAKLIEFADSNAISTCDDPVTIAENTRCAQQFVAWTKRRFA